MTTAFVSHKAAERSRIEPVLAALRGRGVDLWIAPDHVTPGVDYAEDSAAAIERCDALVVFVTKDSMASRHVKAEIKIAFDLNKKIYPIRFEDNALTKNFEFFLGLSHWTNAFGDRSADNVRRLADELQRPTVGPVDPPEGADKRRGAGTTVRSPSQGANDNPAKGQRSLTTDIEELLQVSELPDDHRNKYMMAIRIAGFGILIAVIGLLSGGREVALIGFAMSFVGGVIATIANAFGQRKQ